MRLQSIKSEIYEAAHLLMRRQWLIVLQNETQPGRFTCSIILPCFEKWLGRGHGRMNYFITQMMTGHCSFGVFLHRFGRLRTYHVVIAAPYMIQRNIRCSLARLGRDGGGKLISIWN